MRNAYIIHAGKLITVSEVGTIYDGAIVVNDGYIMAVGEIQELQKQFPTFPIKDFSRDVVTPSLVDCHTHLLEFAPASLYAITASTHFWAGKSILLDALTSGITAIGEQICGHPASHFSIADYRANAHGLPIDITFAATSISIGFEELAHFTSITKSRKVALGDLSDTMFVQNIAWQNEYPGENIFINTTPANFTEAEVPRAGEILFTYEELKSIVNTYHALGKRMGVHVAGEAGIQMALDAGVDVLHHAHGIIDAQVKQAKQQGVKIVATPMGGTHLEPNSPENIRKLVRSKIDVSIASDAYLPPHSDAWWLDFPERTLQGPDVLMQIAQPGMKSLYNDGADENEILAILTANPAAIMEKEKRFGKISQGMDANFLITSGVPGLEITDPAQIKKVYFRGEEVVDRIK